MSTLDAPLNTLYDDLAAPDRSVQDLDREYRGLAERDDLDVDDLGDDMSPAECIARLVGEFRWGGDPPRRRVR